MNNKPPRLATLRFQRAYRLTSDALHTLCCESGGLKDRLQKIDLEFFSLSKNELPDIEALRSSFGELHRLVTCKEPRYPHEGRIAATLDQLHHTKLKAISELIWNIHMAFLSFMQNDDTEVPQNL
ncbi:hypothetical protein [Hydrogenophaga sp. ANAO-22]|uniref:hypothetical protein n=1 Tax=Hydrogenophaga sp. ANAO-22 TaxID=3166645 RepID=UPI0036D41D68